MTKFEELEEAHAELKLKQTLWDSSIEWNVNHEEWMNVRLQRFYLVFVFLTKYLSLFMLDSPSLN